MKTNHFFILGVLLLVLGSCREEMEIIDAEPVESLFSYCSYNYREGDTVCFSMHFRGEMNFVVEHVEQTYYEENMPISYPRRSTPTNLVYAMSSVELRSTKDDYHVFLSLSLTDRRDKPMDVKLYVSSVEYEGIDSVSCQAKMIDKITVAYQNPKSKALDSYLVLKRGIGLSEFGDEHNHQWKHWMRL